MQKVWFKRRGIDLKFKPGLIIGQSDILKDAFILKIAPTNLNFRFPKNGSRFFSVDNIDFESGAIKIIND